MAGEGWRSSESDRKEDIVNNSDASVISARLKAPSLGCLVVSLVLRHSQVWSGSREELNSPQAGVW
jgi:hypothetical protein